VSLQEDRERRDHSLFEEENPNEVVRVYEEDSDSSDLENGLGVGMNVDAMENQLHTSQAGHHPTVQLIKEVRERVDENPVIVTSPEGAPIPLKELVRQRVKTSGYTPAALTIKKLTYAVEVKRNVRQEILKDITFYVKPRTMTLILGPPGSGKTTLFRILANKVHKGDIIKGGLQINGEPPDPAKYHRQVAYVPQEDIHLAALTVMQTMKFAAACQTSREGPKLQSSAERVKTLLTRLGLEHRVDTLVGDDLLRGLSGGEKRRLTIAIQITKQAQLLLADEPTTGLDSSTSFDIFRALRDVSRIAVPIVVSLLQPSFDLFCLFDNLLLLGNGRVAYFGKLELAVPYFESLGYYCPPHYNPADFLQEVVIRPQKFLRKGAWPITRTVSMVKLERQNSLGALAEEEEEAPNKGSKITKKTKLVSAHSKGVVDDFAEAFKMSPYYRHVVKFMEKQEALSDGGFNLSNMRRVQKFPLPRWRQVFLLSLRGFQLMRNNFTPVRTRILKSLVMGAVIGSAFFQLGNTIQDTNNKTGLLFNVLAFIGMGSLANVPAILSVREVFYFQREHKYYSTLPVVLAAIINDLPVSITESLLYGSIVYWCTGLRADAVSFIYFLVAIWLLGMTTNAFTRMAAALAPNFNAASGISTAFLATVLMFSGYTRTLDRTPVFLSWIGWISPFRYTYEGLAINELAGAEIECSEKELVPPAGSPLLDNGTVKQFCPFPKEGGGDFFLEHRLKLETEESYKWIWLGVLFVLVALFQLLAYVTQRLVAHRPVKKPSNDDIDPEREGAHFTQPPLDKRDGGDCVFTFSKVGYTVRAKKEDLVLLKDVNGYVRPGMMLALMGASGAGKTTLLDVLANRKTGGRITGTIQLNGRPTNSRQFHHLVGYCEQRDIHSATSTVREAVLFSARTRLPSDTPPEMVQQHVDWVLETLELTSIQHDLVESAGSPAGISMEQRKRLTIAVELAANPSVLFLDEPTSGLDSVAAESVMQAVRRVVDQGRCVICTIHQPSARIFALFSHLLLLKRGGETIYNGPIGQHFTTLLAYFEKLGHVPTPHQNPADFVLEVSGAGVGHESTGVDPVAQWQESRAHETLLQDISNYEAEQARALAATHEPRQPFYAASYPRQLAYVVQRAFQGGWRRGAVVKGNIFRSVFQGCLLGLMFLQVPTDQFGAGERVALIYFCALIGLLSSQSSIAIIVEDRAVYYREQSVGAYSPLVYTIALLISSIPLSIIYATAFVLPMYFISGLSLASSGLPFWFFYLQYILLVQVGIAMSSAIAVVSVTVEMGNAINAALIGLMSLFAGFMLPRDDIPVYWVWLYHISFLRYVLEALVINELDGLDFHCDKGDVILPPGFEQLENKVCPITSGNQVIDLFGMDTSNFWFDFAMNFVFYFVFVVLTYLGIKYVRSIKR